MNIRKTIDTSDFSFYTLLMELLIIIKRKPNPKINNEETKNIVTCLLKHSTQSPLIDFPCLGAQFEHKFPWY